MHIEATGSTNSQFLQASFNDVNVLGKAIEFDAAFRPLDPGPEFAPASILKSNHISILKMRFNRGYHQCGCPPTGALCFGVPVAGVDDWFGAQYLDQSILPFNQASGIDLVSRGGFEAYAITIAEDFIEEIADTFQLPIADTLSVPSSGAFLANSHSVQKFRSAINGLFNQDLPLLKPELETQLIVQLILAGLTDAPIIDKSAPVVRARALSRALEYLDQHQGEAISVGELSAACDISPRTLTRAFQERFGMGPKAYLNRVRLAAVRTQLSTGEREVLIANIANSQGFWHMGQFARDYRLVYGELPSETLQRSVD
jgi:AraC family ethanolamine operon transcriptional activator